MSYVEVEEEGWFSRIADSIKGILAGFLLFMISFGLLFFNECRAVDRAQDLEAGRGKVVSVKSDKVDKGNEGKLVHVNGKVTIKGKVKDPDLQIEAKALKLVRDVEIYQWKENVKTKTKKKAGGKKKKIKEYTYEQAWVSSPVDSSQFKDPDAKKKKVNTGTMPIKAETFSNDDVTLGAFKLPNEVISGLGKTGPHNLDKAAASKLPGALKGRKATVSKNEIYIGDNPSSPAIGDLRITYEAGTVDKATIIAGQKGNSFTTYKDKDLNSGLLEVSNGIKTSDQMFTAAEESNETMTWILRFVGFMMMFIGLALIFRPLSVVADVIPLIGSLVGGATTLIAFFMAAALSMFTIAIAWIVARPLLGIGLLVLGGLFVGGVVFLAMKNRKG